MVTYKSYDMIMQTQNWSFVQFSISSGLQYPKIESSVNLIHFDFMVFKKIVLESRLFWGFPLDRDPFLLPFQFVVIHDHLGIDGSISTIFRTCSGKILNY